MYQIGFNLKWFVHYMVVSLDPTNGSVMIAMEKKTKKHGGWLRYPTNDLSMMKLHRVFPKSGYVKYHIPQDGLLRPPHIYIYIYHICINQKWLIYHMVVNLDIQPIVFQ